MYITFITNSRFSSVTTNDRSMARRIIKTRIEAARRAKINLNIDIYSTYISDAVEELGQDDVWLAGWTPTQGWRLVADNVFTKRAA